MKTFNDLDIRFNGHNNQCVMMFDNNYGVSVVIGEYTYGGKDGLYELAVLDSKGVICYGTPVTSDVLGYLTAEDVTKAMEEVQRL